MKRKVIPAKITQVLHRCFALILVVLSIVLINAVPSAAAETAGTPAVLRVAFPQVAGFSETDEYGERHGLVVDFLTEISKYTGWEYEYIDVTDGEYMLQAFVAGEYDLVGGSYYSPGLEELFAYPDLSTGRTKSVLLARWDSSEVRGYDIMDLDGKSIGVYDRAVENIRRLKEYLSINGLDCTIRPYTIDDLVNGKLYHKLEDGEVDLLLGNSGDDTGRFRSVAYFDAQPHYIVTRLDSPEILEKLNWAMEQIAESNPGFVEECYEANFPGTGRISVYLDDSEKAYIEEKGTVTVAVPDDFHPLFCENTPDALHDGIVPDLLARISQYSGLEFSYVHTDTYASALEMVKRGEADMAGFFLGTEAEAAKSGLALTQSYAALSNMVVRHKSVSFPSDGLTCAILDGCTIPKDIKTAGVSYFNSVSEALAAVNRHEVDIVYGMAPRIEQELQYHHLANSMPVSLFNHDNDICFALAKPVKPQLLTVINKAICNLQKEELSAIVNQNMISVGEKSLTVSDLIYTNPILAISVVTVILVLATAMAALVAHSRIKNAFMRAELEKAESDSKAKSEFLSRMSHEIRTPMNAIVGLTELIGAAEDVPENIRVNLAKLRSSAHYLLGLINDILDMSRIGSGMMSVASEPFSLVQMLCDLESMMKSEAERRGLEFTVENDIRHSDLTGDAIRLRQVLTNLLSNAFKFTPAGGQVILRILETGSDENGAEFAFSVADSGIGISDEDQARIFQAFEQSGNNMSRSQGTGLGLPISQNIVFLMGGEMKLKSAVGEGSEFYFSITLPYGDPVEKKTGVSSRGLLENAHILLVEDNELNAEIATDLLEMQGVRITLAADGSKAVETFSNAAPGTFDAILMDIQMPVMNGLEATRVIRGLDRADAASIPIVAMTANSFQEDIDAAKNAGMNAFVTKPLDVDYLFSVLGNIMKIKMAYTDNQARNRK